MELNKLIRFYGVDEANFNSIFRRCLVIRVEGRFVDETWFEKNLKGDESYGIFPRQHDLKHFLQSGPAIAAGLRLQHAFEAKHSKADCLRLVTEYTLSGRDRGITEKYLRRACGLPDKSRAAPPDAAPREGMPAEANRLDLPVGVYVEATPPEASPAQPSVLEHARVATVTYMLKEHKDKITQNLFRSVTLSGGPRLGPKQEIFQQMTESEDWLQVAAGGSRAGLGLFPKIHTGTSFEIIVPAPDQTKDHLFLESYDLQAFGSFLDDCAHRAGNLATVIHTLQNARKRVHRPGRLPREAVVTELDHLERTAASLADSVKEYQKIRDGPFNPPRTVPSGSPAGKRRRIDAKQTPLQQHTVNYVYNAVPGRRFVRKFGAQNMPRRALQVLVPHTHDLDICNAVFTIVDQLVARLDIRDRALYGAELETLSRIRNDRTTVIQEELRMPLADGKKLLCAMLGGSGIPQDMRDCAFLHRVRRLACFLRWLACSCMYSTYVELSKTSDKWAEASTFALWWQRCEDWLLTAWTEWIQRVSAPSHLSLHFDGVRIDKYWLREHNMNVHDFCTASVTAIQDTTGFQVDIVEKRHRSLMEQLTDEPVSWHLAGSPPASLLQGGNCIMLAIWWHQDALDCDVVSIATENTIANAAAIAEERRSYRTCFDRAGLAFRAHMGFRPRTTGTYLLHCEDKGRPHCLACRVDMEAGLAHVYHNSNMTTMSLADLRTAVAGCTDRKLIVTFEIGKRGSVLASPYDSEERMNSLDALQDLQAGAYRINADLSAIVDEEAPPIVLPDAGQEGFPAGNSLMEDSVSVRLETEALLQSEVEDYEAQVQRMATPRPDSRRRPHDSMIRCRLCPFRQFASANMLLKHLHKEHTADTLYCGSGRKQLNVVFALYDQDRSEMVNGTAYLRRSADALRESVCPALSVRSKNIDREIVLVLTGTGPQYHQALSTHEACQVRRVGYTYYTRSFCNIMVQEFLMNHGRVRTTIPRIVMRLSLSGSRLVSLLPSDVLHWLNLIEDAFACPWVVSLRQRCLEQCYSHEEFRHISIDATIRVLRRTRGQADYRASSSIRSQAPIPDGDSKRRVLTVLGRTSTVLASFLVRDEASDSVARPFVDTWDKRFRDQVTSVASDQPSGSLFAALQTAFPNLALLSLDPVHLAMVYEQCHYRKSTAGSRKSVSYTPSLPDHIVMQNVYRRPHGIVRLSPADYLLSEVACFNTI